MTICYTSVNYSKANMRKESFYKHYNTVNIKSSCNTANELGEVRFIIEVQHTYDIKVIHVLETTLIQHNIN